MSWKMVTYKNAKLEISHFLVLSPVFYLHNISSRPQFSTERKSKKLVSSRRFRSIFVRVILVLLGDKQSGFPWTI